jgi:hypothetical protein
MLACWAGGQGNDGVITCTSTTPAATIAMGVFDRRARDCVGRHDRPAEPSAPADVDLAMSSAGKASSPT